MDEGAWTYRRRAGNHRSGKDSTPYRRRASAVRAAVSSFPDLEVKVYSRDGSLDRIVTPGSELGSW